MSKKYVPTAKDKAFAERLAKEQKEVQHLRSELLKKANEYTLLEEERDTLLREKADLEASIEAHFGMPSDEFVAHVEREKEASESLKILTAPFKILGGNLYG